MWLDRLAAMKKESGKTLKQISTESGVPIGTLNKLFAGQTKDPKLDTVRSVVHALGHTLDDLTDDAPQNTKKEPPAHGEELSKEELALIELFRRVPQEQRRAMLQAIEMTLRSQELL